MKLNERLKLLRTELKKNQNEMAQALSIAPSTYQYYERGERSIPSEVLEKIFTLFDVNPLWLFKGEKTIFTANEYFEVKYNDDRYPKWDKIKAGYGKRILDAYKKANKDYLLELQHSFFSIGEINAYIEEREVPGNGFLEIVKEDTKVTKKFLEGSAATETTNTEKSKQNNCSYDDIISTPQQSVEVHEQPCMYYTAQKEFVYVPLYEDIYAAADAIGVSADGEYTPRHIAFRMDWLKRMKISTEKLALIHFRGDSMIPTIKHDDIILIDKTRKQIRPERIIILEYNKMIYIKRIQSFEKGYLIAKSDNPSYSYETISMDLENENNKIIGQIVWIGRTMF